MAVTKQLTPAAIAAGDYSTAQTPILGGEVLVYLSASAPRWLGTLRIQDNAGTHQWDYRLAPSSDTAPGPICAVAAGAGIFQVAADTITYAGLTGQFTPSAWVSNQTFNFPTGRGVEMTGTYSNPTSSSVPTLSLSPGAGLTQGSWIDFMELPPWSTFVLAGYTQDRKATVPSRGTKAIPAGMYAAQWTTPGVIQVGNLEITGLNQGYDEGLMRFAGVKCVACLVPMREQRITIAKSYCLNWTGSCDTPYGSGDSEATVTLRGMFDKMVTLPAP